MVDDADFEWLSQWKWHLRYGGGNCYYAARSGNKKKGEKTTVKMHRLILGLTDSKIEADHKDRNGLNNQRENLRIATRSQNLINRKSKTGSTSKYLGVNKKWRKWEAKIKPGGQKIVYLGLFKTEIEAALAYNEAATRLHGEFANLNIIQ